MRSLPLLAALLLCAPLASIAKTRPATWAQPMAVPGVENLYRLTPNLYRCAQPDAAGMAALQRLGIRTEISLRHYHDDLAGARNTRLRLLQIQMDAHAIQTERIARVLALLREKGHGPFVIHCQHGSDRTGVVCAMYRMVEQGWSREAAIQELRAGGYGFHLIWINIVQYLKTVDIPEVRQRVNALAQSR